MTLRQYAIFCTLLICTSLLWARPVLQVVSDDWPPYVIVDGHLQGVDVEVTKWVLSQMGYEVRMHFVPWKRAVQMTKNGEADALLDVGYNEERENYFYYPDEPINFSATTLFCRRCDRTLPARLSTMRGKRIVINRGYSYAGDFDESPHVTLVKVDEFAQGMKLVSLGRADFYVVNRLVGAYIAHSLGLEDIYPIDENLSDANPVYLAFSRQGQHADLAQAFSKALTLFKQSPEYQLILRRYGVD